MANKTIEGSNISATDFSEEPSKTIATTASQFVEIPSYEEDDDAPRMFPSIPATPNEVNDFTDPADRRQIKEEQKDNMNQ